MKGSASMKNCLKCSAYLPQDAEFCNMCGTKQPILNDSGNVDNSANMTIQPIVTKQFSMNNFMFDDLQKKQKNERLIKILVRLSVLTIVVAFVLFITLFLFHYFSGKEIAKRTVSEYFTAIKSLNKEKILDVLDPVDTLDFEEYNQLSRWYQYYYDSTDLFNGYKVKSCTEMTSVEIEYFNSRLHKYHVDGSISEGYCVVVTYNSNYDRMWGGVLDDYTTKETEYLYVYKMSGRWYLANDGYKISTEDLNRLFKNSIKDLFY